MTPTARRLLEGNLDNLTNERIAAQRNIDEASVALTKWRERIDLIEKQILDIRNDLAQKD